MYRRVQAPALLAMVALAACTAQAAKPSTLPSVAPSSPSPSPSASLTPSPSARPVGTDVQQIAALSMDYYLEIKRAAPTGNTTRLRSLSTGNCQCNAIATNLEKVWKAGSIVSPAYYRISQVAGPTVTNSTTGFSTVVYTTSKSVYLNAVGKPIQTFPAETRPQSASLDFVKIDGVWKVSLVSINDA